MTVRITQTVTLSHGTYTAGQVLNLQSSLEADLLRRGHAVLADPALVSDDAPLWSLNASGYVEGLVEPTGAVRMQQLVVAATSTAVSPITSSNGGHVNATLDADTVFTFPSPTSGVLFKFRLTVVQNLVGCWAITWPTAVRWIGATPQMPLAGGSFGVFEFETIDGGTTWLGSPVGSVPVPQAYDLFTRADSTSSLGTATSGGAWTAVAGTWGIISNQGYLATRVGDSIATLATSSATMDITARITLGTGSSNPGILFRYQDSTNYLLVLFALSNQKIDVFRRVAGTYTNISSNSVSIAASTAYTLRIVANGTTVTTYLNGVRVKVDTGVTQFASSTGVGLRQDDATAARYDNLVVV